MPLHSRTPFDRDTEAEPDDTVGISPHTRETPSGELHQLPLAEHRKRAEPRWWGLAADCCYLVISAGAFLMACWVMAMGLPVMLVLLLTGGQMDMTFAFLGSLFGAFADATPDRQYAFASSATWCLIALATLIAAWRLPRFLNEVSNGLAQWKKVP